MRCVVQLRLANAVYKEFDDVVVWRVSWEVLDLVNKARHQEEREVEQHLGLVRRVLVHVNYHFFSP